MCIFSYRDEKGTIFLFFHVVKIDYQFITEKRQKTTSVGRRTKLMNRVKKVRKTPGATKRKQLKNEEVIVNIRARQLTIQPILVL